MFSQASRGEHAAVDEPGPVGGAAELERRRARHQRPVEVEEGGSRLIGTAQRAAAGRRWEQARLRHTLMMTASPWPPPEQIAAQP